MAQLLDNLPNHYDENLLVGYDKSDDASVYRIRDDLALVQTVDFFPPIVDDPYLFGQIAAANSLSDIYAMGATPKLAMNIMCVSPQMNKADTRAILEGGYQKAYEAGVIVTGGHTIEDREPKYGLSVTGFVDPKKMLLNSSVQPGDVLILTKPIGVGIVMTAAQGDMIGDVALQEAYRYMSQLNKEAPSIMSRFTVHSCTDVTGFGLIGHAFEMARGSGYTIHLESTCVPLYDDAIPMASMGFVPAGAYRNRDFTDGNVRFADVSVAMQDVLFDPQTSGGLLIAVPEKESTLLLKELQSVISCASIIGYVTEKEDVPIIVT